MSDENSHHHGLEGLFDQPAPEHGWVHKLGIAFGVAVTWAVIVTIISAVLVASWWGILWLLSDMPAS